MAVQSTGGIPSARLVLRVASERLTTLVNQLANIGHIAQQALQGQDVTGQVVDLAARVTVLQSTLSVEISESASVTGAVPAPKRHHSTAARAWRLAADNTVAVVHGIAIGAGWSAPGLLLVLLLSLPLAIWYRRRRRPASP